MSAATSRLGVYRKSSCTSGPGCLSDTRARTDRPADDRPGRLSPSHFLESGPIEHPLGTEPEEIGVGRFVLVHRVGLEHGGALRTRILDPGAQELLGHTPPPRPLVDEEADDRP